MPWLCRALGRDSFAQFATMVMQMFKIVGYQESKGAGFVGSDCARYRELRFRDVSDQYSNLAIVVIPQFNERFPFAGSIVSRCYPFILMVFGEYQFSAMLRTNEPLVIVAGRIDEMSNDLRKRPSIWLGFHMHHFRVESE